MIVTSPVGEFPFTLERARLRGGRLVLDGRMGAWPARVEVGPGDLPQLARLLRAPLLLGAGGLVAAGTLAVLAARRR